MWSLENNAIEIILTKPDDFLKIKETLTRIGVASKLDADNKTLYQSCHILHKRGKYFLLHFKELFILDGKPSNLSENDVSRRNTIANLLAEWNLLKLVDVARSKDPIVNVSQLKIIPFKEKGQWNLVPKYSIGKKVKQNEEGRSKTVERRDISGNEDSAGLARTLGSKSN